MRFEGIYPPVVTPFHDDLSINWDGWAQIIDHQIEEGVHGIIIGGTTGEFYALSREERLEQMRRGKEIIAGRVPMIIGVNDMRASESYAYAAAAKAAGADALLVAAPPYSLPGERELAVHCLAIDRAANLPIMLYNYPGRTGVGMGEEFLNRVGQNRNFVALKEASGDINRVHLLACRYPHIQLSIGCEDQALEFFAWGARSWVSPMPNFIPGPVIKLYEACAVDGDFDKGRRLMQALLPITTALEQGGSYMQCVKFACEHVGLPGGPVRPPLVPMEKELKREMADVMESAKAAITAILRDETNAVA